ncbi:MAG: hypothetical protein J6Z34_03060 [Clostridia bacterium]|nr:hypothetical protein [Clostridia bacterium]
MAKRKGFMARIIEGPERSENYARSTLPSNRWQLGWDIFKTNFSKLLLLNLLLVLFMVPVFLILFMRSGSVSYEAGQIPFDSFMAYPYVGSLNGQVEYIQIRANVSTLIFLPAAALILAVGLSGILYILRNMVWTEGVFVGSDFWRGVKSNYFVVAGTLLLYSVVLFGGIMSLSFADFLIKTGEGNAVLLNVTKAITYIMLALTTLMAMHMLTMSVTYKLSFFKLVRNAFILSISLLPTNVFFIAFSLVTVLMYLISPLIGGIAFILIGVTGGLLVWTDYCHWIYDRFINDKVPGAKKNRGIYEKPDKETFGNELSEYSEQNFDTVYLNKRPVKPVTDYDVEIVELPQSYSREDLKRLEESKEAMRRDSDKYVEDVLSGKIKADEDLSAYKASENDVPDGDSGEDGKDEE